MFNTYITHRNYNDYSNIATQMKLDRQSRENIAQKEIESKEKEIKSRDRVDISLEEYEAMKDKIKRLREELNYTKNKLEKFGEAANLDIVPDTMRITFCEAFREYDFSSVYECAITFNFIPEEGKIYE